MSDKVSDTKAKNGILNRSVEVDQGDMNPRDERGNIYNSNALSICETAEVDSSSNEEKEGSLTKKKAMDLEMALTPEELTKNRAADKSDMTGSPTDAVAKDSIHGHGDHAGPTMVSLASSAVVCFVIYFVFCIVFSAVVFDQLVSSSNPPFGVPQGVGINLLGIWVGSIFFAYQSGCPGIMAGPDLLPIVFFAEAGAAVMTYLENQSAHHAGDYGDAYGYDDDNDYAGNYADDYAGQYDDAYHHRLLAGGSSASLNEDAIAKVIPTTLVAMMIGNAVTALMFYGLGKMKNTASAIGVIPASVIAGFLTCIGYKVIKLAVLITTGYSFKLKYVHHIGDDLPHANDPWLPLFLAFVHGIVLYTLKRLHIFPAEKLILGFIAVPLVLFFIVCAIAGADFDTLREDGWFLSQDGDGKGCEHDCAFSRTEFWQPLQEVYGSLGGENAKVEWGVLPGLIPIFFMGACMTTLDSMLKLTSSENALGMDLDYNHEMKLGGKATLTSALLVGAPAYGQTKFNVMNLAVGRTSESRIPTLGMGALALVLLVTGLAGPIINILPRFLLGGLCVFAGVGFLFENLWEGRRKMTKISFSIVWIIFLLNFVWEFFILQFLPESVQPMVPGLLIVFVLGIVLSTFEFMYAFMHEAKPPLIRSGNECCSSTIRTEKHENQLARMSPWFQVFSVDSFIFFGTADKLYRQLKEHLAIQKELKPPAERTKFLIFDLLGVTGVDPTAKNVFRKVHRLLKSEGVRLVWAMDHESKYFARFRKWGLHNGTEQYDSLDLALRHIEDELLRHAHNMSFKWTLDTRVRALFEQQVLANVFSISVRPDEKVFSSARLLPWSDKVQLNAGATLCGEDDDNLYLLYSGELRLRARGITPGSEESKFIFPGSFFNLDRVLIAMDTMPGPSSTLGAIVTENSVVLRVSRQNLLAMQKKDAGLAQKLLLTLLVQNEKFRPGRTREVKQRLRREHLANELPQDSLAARLLSGTDFKVNLTESQVKRFTRVFELIRAAGDGGEDIEMGHFARHVSMEASCLGSALSQDQFLTMIHDSCMDEDGDGVLTLDEFLSFLRRLFIADLPSAEVPFLRSLYDDAAASLPEGSAMDEEHVKALFSSLGFNTEISEMKNVLGVIDSDGDGDVSFDEFLTGIGMMKLFYLQVKELNNAFFSYKTRAPQRRVEYGPSDKSLTGVDLDNCLEALDQLQAKDLESLLNVTKEEAEEMVFLADQDDLPKECTECPSPVRSIDSEEFRKLVMAWT